MELRVFTEPQQGATYDDLLTVALEAERLGFFLGRLELEPNPLQVERVIGVDLLDPAADSLQAPAESFEGLLARLAPHIRCSLVTGCRCGR